MLAILTTHPIQYQTPIWKLISNRKKIPFEVWYLTTHGVQPAFDTDFDHIFKWDIDLLKGYPYRFPPEPVPKLLGSFREVKLPADFKKRLQSGEVKALFVMGWNVRAFWQAVFLADRLNIPVWLRGDSNDLKKDFWLKRHIKHVVLGAFFQRISQFLCVGKANQRLYSSYGIPKEKMFSAPHAVDNVRFVKQAAEYRYDRIRLREKWNIPKDALCVLFVGKFVEKKRPSDLIAAIDLLSQIDQTRHYHGLMVGSGKLVKKLKNQCYVTYDADLNINQSLIKGSDVQPNISFTGFLNQTEISKAYVVADVLVLPSTSTETWGLVVNEALVSGLPCIVSDACGSAEDLVKPLNKKFCFPVGEQMALAASIKYIADYPPQKNVLEEHMKKYVFAQTVKSLEELWQELAR